MVKMKKIVRADVFFEIETEKNVSIYEKAWEYLDKILPDVFSVEGSELTIYNLDGTEYFESESAEDE
jgi:hypothetical protein